jgi:aminobenzoyl-glutamate utilization protein B
VYSMNAKERLIKLMEQKMNLFTGIADQIWGFAETRFALKQSADLLCEVMGEEGFKVTRGLAGMKDAFIAEYGQGGPVINV